MQRQIVLDTETTGINIIDGHRIIEIGCLEMIDRRLTGKQFHTYLNPERDIEKAAISVHGLDTHFLNDKPVFGDIVEEFIRFITDAELIIHNAPFDVSFLNYELSLLQQGHKSIIEYCRILDTLQMARKMHVGQRNSLDALCKRYSVDNTKREFHGALLDASLLAQVYLAMTGGQGSFFDSINDNQAHSTTAEMATIQVESNSYNLTVIQANEEELHSHQDYLAKLKETGKCLWQDE